MTQAIRVIDRVLELTDVAPVFPDGYYFKWDNGQGKFVPAAPPTDLSTWIGSTSITTIGTIATGSLPESLVTFTDITTNNATISKHGFLPKLSGSSGDYLSGLGTWLPTAAAGQYRALVYEVSGGTFTFLHETDGTPIYTLENLE